jgi:ubiquinone/menaquinone biosynthesis C-methylase UbiE
MTDVHEDLLPLLECSNCHGGLSTAPRALECTGCGRSFEIIHGIPDFRPPPDEGPRHGPMCRKLMDMWPSSSYRELWDTFNAADGETGLDAVWHEHERRAPERGERRWAEIAEAARAAGRPPLQDGVALDVGCGGGSALFALARRADRVVGLDVALSELLLAKKRLLEAGVENVAFVCASALALPLRSGTMALVNATDVVEHLPDATRFLAEARRVMAACGTLFFNSPNRFSLLTREPHVKLWGVGFLPRAWMGRYVRWRLGREYRGKRLLSLFELRRMLQAEFGRDFRVWALVPRGGICNTLGRALGAAGKPLVPEHNVLAWKPQEG